MPGLTDPELQKRPHLSSQFDKKSSLEKALEKSVEKDAKLLGNAGAIAIEGPHVTFSKRGAGSPREKALEKSAEKDAKLLGNAGAIAIEAPLVSSSSLKKWFDELNKKVQRSVATDKKALHGSKATFQSSPTAKGTTFGRPEQAGYHYLHEAFLKGNHLPPHTAASEVEKLKKDPRSWEKAFNVLAKESGTNMRAQDALIAVAHDPQVNKQAGFNVMKYLETHGHSINTLAVPVVQSRPHNFHQ